MVGLTHFRGRLVMANLWDKIRKSLEDGYKVTKDKTEELTKLGKLKIDILSTKHKISKSFTEIGGIVYEAAKEGKSADVLESPEVAYLVDTIKGLENDLEEKESQYEEITKKEGGEPAPEE